MRAIKPIAALFAIAIMMASCTAGIQEDAEPIIKNEKVDLIFEGAIDNFVSIEDRSGLIDLSKSPEAFLNDNEYQLNIHLDGPHRLNLVLYSFGSDAPLSSASSFSAYPPQMLEDKQVYAVVRYIDGHDNVLYSTTTEFSPPHIQPNILEITRMESSGFSARLRNVTLYAVSEDLRTEQDLAGAAPTLEVTGSITSNNL